MNAIPFALSSSAPFPPPGWELVGAGDVAAAAKARELAPVLPPGHFVDELLVDDQGGGESVGRFFVVDDGDGPGVACMRWVGPDTLGDPTTSPATSTSSSSGLDWTWIGVFLALGFAGFVIYAATRPREAHASSAERRRERDDFAEQNIPDDLVPLWRRERSRFKGTPHERSEAFLEWAETGEGERARLELLEEQSDTRTRAVILERDGCTCNDEDTPHCCGRGCCSYHKGIRGRRDSEVPF